MRAHQADFSVSRKCDVVVVSSSGYYDWKTRGLSARDPEDQKLLEHIKAIHQRSPGTYGSPRLHAALKAEGIRIGKKRVA
jgi:putative transposase